MKSIVKTLMIIFLSGLFASGIIITYLKISNNNSEVLSKLEPSAHAASKGSLTYDEKIVINLYKKIGPSVVNITTTTFQEDFFFNPVPSHGAGSGFVIDKQGHILTNYHVIEGAQKLDVSFGKYQQRYLAKLVGVHPGGDLAIIKVINAPANLLVPVRMGNSNALQVGQNTIAIGNPFGLGQTVTTGVVSSLNRKVKTQDGRIVPDLIQTDAAINRGNSGGPLLNSIGQVIGINTLIFSPSGGSVGIGFAIPINVAKRFIPDLIKYGKVSRVSLGVTIFSLDRVDISLKKKLGLPIQGLLVVSAIPGGSAQNSGIKGATKYVMVGNYKFPFNGDVITAIDGIQVKTEADLISYLESRKKVGDIAKVTVIRKGKKYTANVKLKPAKTYSRSSY